MNMQIMESKDISKNISHLKFPVIIIWIQETSLKQVLLF